jgi:hypothetical protein
MLETIVEASLIMLNFKVDAPTLLDYILSMLIDTGFNLVFPSI